MQQYEGGYTDNLEARARREAGAENPTVTKTTSSQNSKDWKQNRRTKLKFSYMEQKEYDTIDDDIASLEEQIESFEQEMLANATNSAKLSEILSKKEEAEKKLNEKMERWVYLNDLAERIAAEH